MFPFVAILICIVEITATHFYGASQERYAIFYQSEIVLLTALGIFSHGRKRKPVLTVFAVWFSWIFISDWYPEYVHDIFGNYEAIIFSFMVILTLVKPYHSISHEINNKNVCLAFYGGEKAPLLSTLSALVGLPFSSVAVIAGGNVLRPHNGVLRLTPAKDFKHPEYTIIDTGVPVTTEIELEMGRVVGNSVKRFGLGMGCVSELSPVLEMVGIRPKSIIPSIFYYQAVKHARK